MTTRKDQASAVHGKTAEPVRQSATEDTAAESVRETSIPRGVRDVNGTATVNPRERYASLL